METNSKEQEKAIKRLENKTNKNLRDYRDRFGRSYVTLAIQRGQADVLHYLIQTRGLHVTKEECNIARNTKNQKIKNVLLNLGCIRYSNSRGKKTTPVNKATKPVKVGLSKRLERMSTHPLSKGLLHLLIFLLLISAVMRAPYPPLGSASTKGVESKTSTNTSTRTSTNTTVATAVSLIRQTKQNMAERIWGNLKKIQNSNISNENKMKKYQEILTDLMYAIYMIGDIKNATKIQEVSGQLSKVQSGEGLKGLIDYLENKTGRKRWYSMKEKRKQTSQEAVKGIKNLLKLGHSSGYSFASQILLQDLKSKYKIN